MNDFVIENEDKKVQILIYLFPFYYRFRWNPDIFGFDIKCEKSHN